MFRIFIIITIFFSTLLSKNIELNKENVENVIKFTKEEQEWISRHQRITVGVDPNYFPHEQITKNGEYDGISADFIKLLGKKIGIEFKYVTHENWFNTYKYARDGMIDALSCVGDLPSRRKDVVFTKPYTSSPLVIFGNDKVGVLDSMESLNGKKVAVIAGYATHLILKNNYPKIKLLKYNNVKEAMTALTNEEVNYHLNTLPVGEYYTRKYRLENIRVVYNTKLNLNFSFALSKKIEKPDVALKIMQKGLDNISYVERMNIINRWLIKSPEAVQDYSLLINISILLIIIIVIIMIWNRKLTIEVKKRRIAELQLLSAREKAIKATKAKSNFLANMSHEIRTPLNAIMGLTNLSLNKTTTEEIYPYLNKVLLSSEHLLGVINDILDFSKIEENKIIIEKIPFNLNKIIDDLISLFQENASLKGIKLIVVYDSKLPSDFLGDPLRIRQIITNFISNAIKFTNKGSITIKIEKLGELEEKTNVRISVIDTGIGIKKEKQKKLFEPFMQEDISTTRNYGGTGLGLAITKQLSTLMDGQIGIKSVENKGSTFYFEVPLKKTQEIKDNSMLLRTHISQAKILVLDDDNDSLDIIKDLMTNYSFDVIYVASIEEAISLLKKINFDLIVLDWKMPKMNGIEFYEFLSENKNIYCPKALLISVHDDINLYKKAKAIGISSIIQKPFSGSRFLVEIVNTLGKNVLLTDSNYETNIQNIFFNNQTILLVEDNILNQEVAIELLQNIGFNIIIADNGKEAVEIFKKRYKEISLILMDLQMPIMDGYNASRNIRNFEYGNSIPIVALSADAISTTKEKVIAYGMNNYATKPIKIKELFKILSLYLEHTFINKQELKNHITNIPEIYGIDAKKEIERLFGKKDAYKKLITSFAKNFEGFIEPSKKLDTKELLRRIHQIKGVSGNIGATVIYKKAIKIEEKILSKLDYEYELNEIATEIKMTIESIKKSELFDNNIEEKSFLSNVEILKILSQLSILLEEADTESETIIEKLMIKELDPRIKNHIWGLKDDIENYKFTSALAKTKKLMEFIK